MPGRLTCRPGESPASLVMNGGHEFGRLWMTADSATGTPTACIERSQESPTRAPRHRAQGSRGEAQTTGKYYATQQGRLARSRGRSVRGLQLAGTRPGPVNLIPKSVQ
jgi:hypothetical protein